MPRSGRSVRPGQSTCAHALVGVTCRSGSFATAWPCGFAAHSAQECIVAARGINQCSALETALKLSETSYLRAHPFSAADRLLEMLPPSPAAKE